jgi:hypothetical protein
MAYVWLGSKVGSKARRAPEDPRMLANERPGQSFQSKVDHQHYVALKHPLFTPKTHQER